MNRIPIHILEGKKTMPKITLFKKDTPEGTAYFFYTSSPAIQRDYQRKGWTVQQSLEGRKGSTLLATIDEKLAKEAEQVFGPAQKKE